MKARTVAGRMYRGDGIAWRSPCAVQDVIVPCAGLHAKRKAVSPVAPRAPRLRPGGGGYQQLPLLLCAVSVESGFFTPVLSMLRPPQASSACGLPATGVAVATYPWPTEAAGAAAKEMV